MQEPTLIPGTEPQKYTEKQIRELRRTYVTVRHGTVRACGHKIDLNGHMPPRNNCTSCWQAWFKTVDGLLVHLHEILVTQGLHALKAQYGDKVVKQFARFLDNELNQERNDGISKETEGGTGAEASGSGTGVGSGEVQGPIHSLSSVGQEAPNNEQPDAARETTESSNQDDQHGAAEPRL